MSDVTEAPEADEPPTHPTRAVTINIPEGMLKDYDADVERGLYATREAALLDALVEGWRHHKGRYSTLRVDIGLAADEKTRPDNAKPDIGDMAAAADELKAGEEEEDARGDKDA